MLIYHTENTGKFLTAINTISVSATAALQLHPDLLFKKEKKSLSYVW